MAKCNRWTLRKCSSSQRDSREGGKEAGNKDKMKGKIAGREEQHHSFSSTWLNPMWGYKTKEEGFLPPLSFFFCVYLTVWAVVNILSPPLADGVKGVCCSPGQWRPHFYMWTAVNTTEWHTTKVGCAAALSLLNGTLAFNFARVSGTHTLSSISSPNVCVWVCFISFQKQEIRQRTSLWDGDGRVQGWAIRQRGAHYISQRDYLHFWVLIMLILNGLST